MPGSVYGLPPAPAAAKTKYRKIVLATPNILSCWPFDETSGTTSVDIVRGLNGTLSGSYTLGVTGPSGGIPRGISFTGGISTVSAIVQPSVSTYSWELFFQTSASPGNNLPIIDGRNADVGSPKSLSFFLGQLNSSGLAGAPLLGLDAAGTALGSRTNTAFNDGKWHHVILAWAGTAGVAFANTQVTIYVDGRLAGQTSADTAGAPVAPFTGGAVVKFGNASVSGVSLAFVTNYSRALTAAEALTHYVAAGSPGG